MPVFIFHINNGKEITYLILYKEMKNMNGNNPAGAQAESRLRLLLTYKGSAYAGEDIQDDIYFSVWSTMAARTRSHPQSSIFQS